MKNLCLSMFIVLLIYSSAESCDQTDPACVASKIFESTVSFRTEGTKKYYCEDNIVSYDFAVAAGKAMSEAMKDQGIDYFRQAYHDFENVKYKIIHEKSNRFLVKVSGSVKAGFAGTGFSKELKVDETFYLHKEKDSDKYCFPNQLKIQKSTADSGSKDQKEN